MSAVPITPRHSTKGFIEDDLADLLRFAHERGFIVTVENKVLPNGQATTVTDVRNNRENYEWQS